MGESPKYRVMDMGGSGFKREEGPRAEDVEEGEGFNGFPRPRNWEVTSGLLPLFPSIFSSSVGKVLFTLS